MTTEPLACGALIKEIGRGAHGARALSAEQASVLFAAILDGRVSDLELGAVLMAYRIKGEAPEELAGMLRAAQAHLHTVRAPAAGPQSLRPVSIPSYNGARKQANLTPLLALLLAQRGVPVVVHGVRSDAGRVSSAEIFAALGMPAPESTAAAEQTLNDTGCTFLPIDILSPGFDRLLRIRARMGVRNSAHTLVKLLDPFATGAQGGETIRLVNYTHPPYRDSLAALFTGFPDIAIGDILLARGTEGEAVADTRRQVQIDRFRNGQNEVVVEAARREISQAPPVLPPAGDAQATADWIRAALADPARIPDAILRQAELIGNLAGAPR